MRFADLITDALETGRDRLNRADTMRRLNDSFRRTLLTAMSSRRAA